MNCFQFCIFAVLFTTKKGRYIYFQMLWIAFNFVSLQCYLQQVEKTLYFQSCCELLSILYLCSVIYNSWINYNIMKFVVNCFQFCIFAVLFTTIRTTKEKWKWLWIAFNFVSLQCYLQLCCLFVKTLLRCELLSILYLCSVIYNVKIKYNN